MFCVSRSSEYGFIWFCETTDKISRKQNKRIKKLETLLNIEDCEAQILEDDADESYYDDCEAQENECCIEEIETTEEDTTTP